MNLDDFPFEQIIEDTKESHKVEDFMIMKICQKICSFCENNEEIIKRIQQVLIVYGKMKIMADDYVVEPYSRTLFRIYSNKVILDRLYRYKNGRNA